MIKRILKSYDFTLIAVIIAISIFGLVMVYSASMVTAVSRFGLPSDFFYIKQFRHLIIGFILFFIVAAIPYPVFKNKKFLVIIVLGSIISLVALNFIGHTAGNAESWFKLGALGSLQPSEFIKLGMIIYLSAVYSNKQKYINVFNKGVVPPLLFLLVICLLIVLQPDIGTAFILFMSSCTIILCSGMNFKSLGKLLSILFGAILVATPIIFLFKDKIFTPKRLERFVGFLDPFSSEKYEGYQLVNSYVAIGNGGITGVGFGQSTQKYGYLPEPHTDFIMSVISEELGLIGVGFVIICLATIVLKGIHTAIKSNDPFGSMLAVGISSMIGIQAMVNLGGVAGLIPITGVTLPFISYGGSSLIILLISVGLLVNVSMMTRYDAAYKKEPVEKGETLQG
ncbi:FtsW/RodA/SpoVE family cell cycle protein [Pradoshia sp. D12]|uniref:FtsW/RodA/SpoVE family cell cycle protein n=1 Tax=Bacillaceae TaxID=186817 RepID=UPI00080ACB18|nr:MULTISPECIES: FtsW/RodA/SpoVE family cell cycle protein [Bacillaceae]OCA89747.1 cell division protein FtsW [Bacillus sp. FJAT-27986]QFK70857.1 FtsW/RodA/SpoVE family cell cycle protein [Pradoshia sp. D12]TPF72649.1 FtsW/RodA/SpoVE family cell cycle protein [Bacillus sp. D12]